MKEKKLIISFILLVILIPGLTAGLKINYVDGFTTNMHTRIAETAGLVIRQNIDDYSWGHHLEDFKNELYALRTTYPTNYFVLIKDAQTWSDAKNGDIPIRSQNHFWDPIDEAPLILNPQGGPYYVETYFNLAVDFYMELNPEINVNFDPEYVTWNNGDLPLFNSHNTLVDKLNTLNDNFEKAYFCLGVALHVVVDVVCPVHAVNTPAEAKINLTDWDNSLHIDIESRITEHYEDDSIGFINLLGSYGLKKDWEDNYNVRGWVHQAALFGRERNETIVKLDRDNPNLEEDLWDIQCQEIVDYTHSVGAGFLFYFWQYVNHLDIDSDGLSIQEEEILKTDILKTDTDSDGMSDGFEVNNGFDPLTNDANSDADGDTLTNLEEFLLGTNPHNMDTDGEGLNDNVEVDIYGTNPILFDTDGDGWSDYQECVEYHTDPNNPDSFPDETPESVMNFMGSGIDTVTIRFTWDHPINWIDGWTYKIEVLIAQSYSVIGETTSDSYMFSNTQYTQNINTYRISCYNEQGIHGSYSYWVGKASTSGGFFR